MKALPAALLFGILAFPHSIPTGDTREASVEIKQADNNDHTLFVGLLQAAILAGQGLLFWFTLRAINRQAREMKLQREEMHGQFVIMRGQLGAMESSGREITEQTKILQASVRIAEKSADAAKQNVEIFISKERARIAVEAPKELQLVAGPLPLTRIKYKIDVSAPTPAIIVDAQVSAEITNSRVLDTSPFATSGFTHSMSIASKDTRTTSVIERSTLIFESIDQAVIDSINTKQKFVHFHGFIRYKDIFQAAEAKPHETAFRYLWEVGSDVRRTIPSVGERFTSEWVENPPGSYAET
jgi:hypothetical protein